MKPYRLPGLRPYRLYSEATADEVYREGRRDQAWVFAAVAPVLGGLFIAVTLFLPQGILGTAAKGWHALAARRRAALAEKGVSPPGDPPPAAPRETPAAPVVQFQAAPAE